MGDRPDMSYSLTETVRDGIVTAPRWVQHLVKVATSTLIFWGLVAFGCPTVLAGALGGPVFWACLALRERRWPSDPATYPFIKHLTDWANDCALATAGSLVPALLLARYARAAGLTLLGCFAVWLAVTLTSYITQEPYARP